MLGCDEKTDARVYQEGESYHYWWIYTLFRSLVRARPIAASQQIFEFASVSIGVLGL
jgi:hypothetical protein